MTIEIPRGALERVADLLDEAGTELETLGVRLCSDEAIVARHIGSLQAIDLLAQTQRSIANVLRGHCWPEAINALGVEYVRQRLM